MAKRRASPDVTGSTITLGGVSPVKVYSQFGLDIVLASRTCTRHTETKAEQRAKIGELTELHRELMYLERVCLQPDKYPEVKDRPLRRISGYHMHEWIGKRLQIGVKDVATMLDQVEGLLRQNARAEAW